MNELQTRHFIPTIYYREKKFKARQKLHPVCPNGLPNTTLSHDLLLLFCDRKYRYKFTLAICNSFQKQFISWYNNLQYWKGNKFFIQKMAI
jgi:hypothetical protein